MVFGAVIPSLLNTPQQVREFLARNSLLQRHSEDRRMIRRMSYVRPGRVLLAKGGPVLDFFSPDNKLNDKGRHRLSFALLEELGLFSRPARGRWIFQDW